MARVIKSKPITKEYKDGWDRIFGEKKNNDVGSSDKDTKEETELVGQPTEDYHSGE